MMANQKGDPHSHPATRAPHSFITFFVDTPILSMKVTMEVGDLSDEEGCGALVGAFRFEPPRPRLAYSHIPMPELEH